MKYNFSIKQKSTALVSSAAAIISTSFIPAVAFAQTSSSPKSLYDLVVLIIKYFNLATVFIISLAVLMFVYNVYNYFIKSDADRKEAGTYVLYSIIGFFIIVSFWGLVTILKNTFNLDNSSPTVTVFGTTITGAGIGGSSSGYSSNGTNLGTGYNVGAAGNAGYGNTGGYSAPAVQGSSYNSGAAGNAGYSAPPVQGN